MYIAALLSKVSLQKLYFVPVRVSVVLWSLVSCLPPSVTPLVVVPAPVYVRSLRFPLTRSLGDGKGGVRAFKRLAAVLHGGRQSVRAVSPWLTIGSVSD